MKNMVFSYVLLAIIVSLSACNINHMQPSVGANQIEESSQKYNIDQNGFVWDYMSTLNIPLEKGDNFEIFTDEVQTGYHYRVNDNYGNLLDYGYHDWRGSFGFDVKDGLLELDYGFGSMFVEKRYYDVSAGRISRFFSKPVQTYGELVVYFTRKGENSDWVLVIQNMFDSSIYYQEIARDFSLYVFTMPSTAEFLDDGRRLKITYWLEPDNKEITEIIDLEVQDN